MIEVYRAPLYKVCKRCGKKLKSLECRERGYGKICWEKYKNSRHQKKLFTIT